MIENFFPKSFHLDSKGQRVSKKLGITSFRKPPYSTQQLDVRLMIICAFSLPCAFMLRGGSLVDEFLGWTGGMDGTSYLMI